MPSFMMAGRLVIMGFIILLFRIRTGRQVASALSSQVMDISPERLIGKFSEVPL